MHGSTISRILHFFVDDGVSGVTYDRSGFQAMLAEIEAEVALFLGHGA